MRMSMGHRLQVTLALLKPDVAVNPVTTKVITDKILQNKLKILKTKTLHWKRKEAEVFYKQHQGRFFYERLLDYVTCGPVIALVLGGQNAIQSWRGLMGPTKTFRAQLSFPHSIRGEFGLTDTRNSTHGSDSEISAEEEIQMVFGEGNKKLWDLTEAKEKAFWNDSNVNQSLGLQEYWTYFYNRNNLTNFEWFLQYKDLRDNIISPITSSVLSKLDNLEKPIILDIGCGNSMLGPNIAKELKVADIYCIDYTIEALHKFRQQMDANETFDNVRNCSLINADLRENLPFENNSVCVIIDKGTTDSIMKQEGGEQIARNALSNVLKLLCVNGSFIKITDEPPEIHMELLQEATKNLNSSDNFNISCRQILSDTGGEYFLYTINKL